MASVLVIAITGVHRTYLHPKLLDLSGGGKAPIGTPRRAMGHLLGNAVRFGLADDVMAAGEGIETILSFRSVVPGMPMVAALSPVFRATKDIHERCDRQARADARVVARPCQAGDPPPRPAALALATPGLADGQGCSAALRFNLSPKEKSMNMMTLSQSDQPVSGGFRVDVSRGQRIGRVSSEWFARPDDERFLNLPDLYESVRGRAGRAQARTVESRAIRVEANRDNSERLALMVPGRDEQVMSTHWSFGQLCTLVGAPTSYLRQLPAALSAINLQHGLLSHRAELVKTLEADNGRIELRAVTGPDYGRIWDHELVAAVMKIAGNGIGDTRWKVPGVMDWSRMTHNPFVDVTKETTTLYASDRDVFVFLVDDTNPIEAGRLPDGSPDLYFRGFYCWNSEVGSKTLGIASFYLRAVCMNRNLWGVENFEEITIRHSKFAAQRFAHEAAPALTSFANSSPAPFVAGIKAARARIVARTDEDREGFLRKGGFSKSETARIIETVLGEENRKPESVFDFVQEITALARTKSHQDARLELEGKAKRLMERAI